MTNGLFILVINSDFIFPDELQIIVNRLNRIGKDLSYFLVAGLPYIIAKFNYQFNVTSKFFEVCLLTISSLLF